MAHIKDIAKVKLIIGLMFVDENIKKETIKELVEKYGPIQESLSYDFNFTDYYNPEMGEGIKKELLVFSNLIDREKLAEIKTFTNTIEDKALKDTKEDNESNNNDKEDEKQINRLVNLDPGYLTLMNVILASAKEMPHKIYFGLGLFGDVVLEYKQKSYQHSPHTFPDYRSDIVKEFLNKVRQKYKHELKDK